MKNDHICKDSRRSLKVVLYFIGHITSYLGFVVTITSVSCTVSDILPLTVTVYVTSCDHDKPFSFHTTVEITGYIRLSIHM